VAQKLQVNASNSKISNISAKEATLEIKTGFKTLDNVRGSRQKKAGFNILIL